MCPLRVASGSVVDDRRSHSFSTGLLSSPEAIVEIENKARQPRVEPSPEQRGGGGGQTGRQTEMDKKRCEAEDKTTQG